MIRLLRAIYVFEIHVAIRLGALGDFWAGHAARRLGILSENFPGSARE